MYPSLEHQLVNYKIKIPKIHGLPVDALNLNKLPRYVKCKASTCFLTLCIALRCEELKWYTQC